MLLPLTIFAVSIASVVKSSYSGLYTGFDSEEDNITFRLALETNTVSKELFKAIQCDNGLFVAKPSLESCYEKIKMLEGSLSAKIVDWSAFPSILAWKDSEHLSEIVDLAIRYFPKFACNRVTNFWEPSVLLVAAKLTADKTDEFLNICPEADFNLKQFFDFDGEPGADMQGIQAVLKRIGVQAAKAVYSLPWLDSSLEFPFRSFLQDNIDEGELSHVEELRQVRTKTFKSSYLQFNDLLFGQWYDNPPSQEAQSLLKSLTSLGMNVIYNILWRAQRYNKIHLVKQIYHNCMTTECRTQILEDVFRNYHEAFTDLLLDDHTD